MDFLQKSMCRLALRTPVTPTLPVTPTSPITVRIGLILEEWVHGVTEGENRAEAMNRILGYVDNQSEKLDLSELNLLNLPDICNNLVFKMNLRILDLTDNRLTTLPESIKLLARYYELKIVYPIKQLSISRTVAVKLVPCRKEYKEITDDLWWTKIDYDVFKSSAVTEIRTLLQQKQADGDFPRVRTVMDELYQPDCLPSLAP